MMFLYYRVSQVRPPLQSGDGKSVGLYVDPSNDKVVVGNKYVFAVDQAIPSFTPQSAVYDKFSGIISRLLEVKFNLSYKINAKLPFNRIINQIWKINCVFSWALLSLKPILLLQPSSFYEQFSSLADFGVDIRP